MQIKRNKGPCQRDKLRNVADLQCLSFQLEQPQGPQKTSTTKKQRLLVLYLLFVLPGRMYRVGMMYITWYFRYISGFHSATINSMVFLCDFFLTLD